MRETPNDNVRSNERKAVKGPESLWQLSTSASSRRPRTPSAVNILVSGTRESRRIPSAHGRCADSRGRSSCRGPEDSSRAGRRTRGQSRRSQELLGRGGRKRCHRATVALAPETLTGLRVVAAEICETSPVNIAGTIDGARRAFEIAGRGCLVRIGENEPRYATVAEIAARLEPHPDAPMLLRRSAERSNGMTLQGKPRSFWRSPAAIRY
jgi:hypothetical protein